MIARQDIFESLQAVMVAITGHDETTAETFGRLGVDHEDFCSVLADFHDALSEQFYDEQAMAGFIYGFLTGLACGRREDYDV